MRLLKLNNEFYLIGDDELEIKGGDSYYVNGRITESAGGEIEKGDYRDCEKVLAATVQLRGLPLIDRNEVEKIFRDRITELALDTFFNMSNVPSALRGQFVSGFINGYIKKENENENENNFTTDEMISFCQECLILANSNEIGRVRKFIDERLDAFIRKPKPKTEWWHNVSVEGLNFPYHSKKWNKTLGRTIPSVNEKGYITIKQINKK